MNGDLSSERWDIEIESLLNLMREYTDKLRARSTGWLHRRQRFQWIFWSILFSWFVISWSSAMWVDKNPPNDQFVLFVSVVSLSALLAIFISYFAVRRRALLEANDIATLINVVEKLVRRSSQIEDHAHMNFTNQIALDLRLAEAESALRLAKLVPRAD